ncbi:MAG: NAD(P)-dependent oxidoreductase [Gemmatimonadetes bacterium]|nr:NAD(P)-dependent oxidoreductase [Gemmatimonadota bacterium]
MILVDTALERRAAEGRPIRAAMVGAGFMGRGIALQLLRYVRGIELVAIANRHLEAAERAYRGAGVHDLRVVETVAELEDAISRGTFAITEDALLLARAGGIDAIIEVTGAVEFAAHVVLEAIRYGKHVILMDAELDGTLGPILKVYADRAGVVYTNSDGDQPGVIMNLYRFVRGIGVRPVLCGNIKGLHDPYRNPTTQVEFAARWGQKPKMVASFADGSKISFEQAIVANGTGMHVARRGMIGPNLGGAPIAEAMKLFPLDLLLEGEGIVDYVVDARPAPGVFVFGTHDDPVQQHYLNLYKLGEGPLYCFYTPYHLCHFEVHNTVARAVLFGDAALAPRGEPCVDVVTTAKVDLKPGDVLDGLGGYLSYGQCENAATTRRERLLPMGLAEGCRIKRPVRKDQVLTYDDVELPPGRLCDRLRAEQDAHFAPAPRTGRILARQDLASASSACIEERSSGH